ncbi:DNA-protecting protein DprA [Guyparkeria halophila]|uniref:DNA-protecting protein DprA n=2 Tax=Thioalkalibacteraceae TaxID=2035710 RepID=A0A6I6D7N5_9GAMM|nr:DNA-processing protein DprA [Guyparkeria hydrothermalis]QGT79511.1 DNA-protecting protein DprA [Guyparkeria halophila]TKA88371.1 DNA-protecting protein DprA [Guyparkeria sp. SB14A]
MGPKRLALLLTHFSTPTAALDAPRREWHHAGLPEGVTQARADAEKVAAITDWLAADATHHLIARGDPHFPAALEDLPDAPAALFARGRVAALSEPQIAMVGSRTPTTGGRQNARAFARHLAAQGLVITSGLALGVDGEAHRGALDVNGITIAVLGSGIDRLYPPEHASLADEIVAGGGVILSEWLPGTEPRRGHFPRRNRLISGLACGVLVVEASVKSGSLITARLAGEQGRDVFAIPGSIHNPLARGCHHLIREGAKLVETGQDVLEELAPTLRRQLEATATATEESAGPGPEAPPSPRDPEQQRILELLGHDPQPADTLIEASGLTAGEVSSILLMLELAGEVSTLPGGLYVRTS